MIKQRWVETSLLLVGIIVLYFIFRLTNLTLVPIFTDEAIYIRWSQIGSRDAAWRFISLTDGKQPLFTWIMMVVLKFIRDPLYAGRFVSVLAGFGSLVGLWFLAQETFHKNRISILTCFLYVIFPFSLMYDRMALYDSLVATLSIWNLYLAILLVRYLRLDVALILGLTLGTAMLNKTSGFFGLYLLPFTLILFNWKSPKRISRLTRFIVLATVSAMLSQAIYSVLRLSPFFHIISQKDAVFIYPFSEWLDHTFRFVRGNLIGLFDWTIHYMTIPLFCCSIATIIYPWRNMREKLVLYGWWFIPFLGLAIFARVLYPRFILFMSMPLILLAAVFIDMLLDAFSKKWIGVLIFILIIFPAMSIDMTLITNPSAAKIPNSDKGQYLQDWPSGWGVKEAVNYLQAQAIHKKISIYTDGTFGLLPYAIEIYLVDNPNVSIYGLWPIPKIMPENMMKDALDHPTFFIMNQSQDIPQWPLQLIAEYPKGNRTDLKLRMFRVVSTIASRL